MAGSVAVLFFAFRGECVVGTDSCGPAALGDLPVKTGRFARGMWMRFAVRDGLIGIGTWGTGAVSCGVS
jgi:hypothetical protein